VLASICKSGQTSHLESQSITHGKIFLAWNFCISPSDSTPLLCRSSPSPSAPVSFVANLEISFSEKKDRDRGVWMFAGGNRAAARVVGRNACLADTLDMEGRLRSADLELEAIEDMAACCTDRCAGSKKRLTSHDSVILQYTLNCHAYTTCQEGSFGNRLLTGIDRSTKTGLFTPLSQDIKLYTASFYTQTSEKLANHVRRQGRRFQGTSPSGNGGVALTSRLARSFRLVQSSTYTRLRR
jgi:hypothetical protein